MKYLPQGSFNQILSIPQLVPQNLASFPVSVAAKKIGEHYYPEATKTRRHPEADAIQFYCLNHLVAIIRNNFDRNEILPEWAQEICKAYATQVSKQGQRMYSYLLMICTREARHFHGEWGELKKQFGPTLIQYMQNLPQDAESAAMQICNTAPVGVELGDYCQIMQDLFIQPGAFGGSFGGKPWSNIAKCLTEMVKGKTSMELMVDVSYSLAHNGGPIFNKGMLYHMYHQGNLLKLLDVQRSGQIPEAILNAEPGFTYQPDYLELQKYVKTVQEKIPGSIGTFINWIKVKEAGALGQYQEHINIMLNNHPELKPAPAPVKPPPPPPPAKSKTEVIGGVKMKSTGEFHVLPGKTVTMYKRVG